MVTTTTVTITDTGKRRTVSASAEETDIVNSGTAVSLHGVELKVVDGAILGSREVYGKLSDTNDAGSEYSSAEVDHVGAKIPVITLRGILDFSKAADKAKIQHLRRLSKTKGYKELAGDIPNWTNGTDDSSTLNVRVKMVTLTHVANSNVMSYVIEMRETA